MGLLADEYGNVRWRAGGLVLVLILAAMLLPPLLRNKEIAHPRSGQQRVDLCALLPEPPAPLAGATRQRGTGGSTICELKSASNTSELVVGMTTTREASVGGPQRTSTMYDTWVREVVASGANEMREQPGNWAKASTYRDRQRNNVLIEDHGVLLMLSSDRLSSDALLEYARAVTAALRKP